MKILGFILFLFSANAFADLYLQTEYQEGRKPKVVTKNHIFLNKPATIKYVKKSYILTLTKMNGNEATIESESYDVDDKGHKTQQGGSLGTYKIGSSFNLVDHDSRGQQKFILKVILEKFSPIKP